MIDIGGDEASEWHIRQLPNGKYGIQQDAPKHVDRPGRLLTNDAEYKYYALHNYTD
jgi:hypothetical protein